MAKRSKAGGDQEPPVDSFERLIREMERLPGIGRRSAERMAYHLLNDSYEKAMALAVAIRDVKKKYHPCSECGDLTESDLCAVCQNPARDKALVMVVEWPKDVRAIEKTGAYSGRYHVLMGRLSPLAGVEAGDLRMAPLLNRVQSGSIRELVLATSPSMEGDATADYIRGIVQKAGSPAKITRLARGLPAGSDLSYSQAGTIGEAIRGRRELG